MYKLETTPIDLNKLSSAVEIFWLKKLMIFRLMILVILLKNITTTQKIKIIKSKFLIMINILIFVILINYQVQ